jgi:uncharacterized protein (TIGR03437 family)
VQGVEVRVASDPNYPASASCVGSVLTDAKGNAVCNLQFGSAEGAGRIRIHVGNNYDIYGPFALQVSAVSSPTPPPPTGTPVSSLIANPASLIFQYPGPVTQNVAVIAASGSVAYTAAVQLTLARVDWLSVGAPNGPAFTDGRSTFAVTVSPQSLQAGTYYANIAIHPTGGGQDIIIPVQLIVGGGGGTPPPVSPPPPTTPPSGTPVSLTATPSLLTFQYPGPVTQNVAVIASSGSASYTPAVQVTLARVDWLTVGAPNGPAYPDARSTFPVNVIPQSLTPGTYRATIAVHPVYGGQDAIVNVQLIVAPSVVTVAPGSMRLSQVAGRGSFTGGSISVTSSGAPVPFVATVSGANWLTVSPATGITPGNITVSVNGSGLPPGNYIGTISINAPGAANSLIELAVNLTVEPSQSLRLSTNSLTFTSEAGGPAPPSQTIFATASDGTLLFTAAAAVVSPAGGNWLQMSPANGAAGSAAANIVVSVNPGGLEAGTYTALITLTSPSAANSPQAVNVTYVITPLATPVPTFISNAANGLPGAVAPGEIVTIRGRSLGPVPGVETGFADGFVQTLLSETRVTFDDIVAPLLYVSGTQINVIVPYALAGRTSTRMVVSYKRAASAAITLAVAEAAPAIFVNDATGQGAIVNEDGNLNGPATPALKGRVVILFATGEGATTPFGTDGKITPADGSQLKRPVLPVMVTIGGLPAEVQYAGSAPGLVSGLMQINVVVPEDAPSGDAVPVTIAAGAIQGQGTASMAIQ